MEDAEHLINESPNFLIWKVQSDLRSAVFLAELSRCQAKDEQPSSPDSWYKYSNSRLTANQDWTSSQFGLFKIEI